MSRNMRVTLVVILALLGALLGSYVHAHAATVAIPTAKTPVVYATQGNPGFSDPRSRPGYMTIEQGSVAWKASWRTWGKTAVSRRAKEQDCGPAGCTAWSRVSLKFYSIGYHTIKNIGGGRIRIKYYRWLQVNMAGNLTWYTFGKQKGTRQYAWYQPDCSIHGGPCAPSAIRLDAAMIPSAACYWHLNVSHSKGSFWVRARLRRYTSACGRKHLRFRAAGLCLTPSGTHGERGNWINKVPQLSSARCPTTFWINYGYDYQFGHGKIHYVKLHGV